MYLHHMHKPIYIYILFTKKTHIYIYFILFGVLVCQGKLKLAKDLNQLFCCDNSTYSACFSRFNR